MTYDDEEFMDAMDLMLATFGDIKDEFGQDIAIECAGTLWASLVHMATQGEIENVEVVTMQ